MSGQQHKVPVNLHRRNMTRVPVNYEQVELADFLTILPPQKPSNHQVDSPGKQNAIEDLGAKKKQVKFEMSITSNSQEIASSSLTESQEEENVKTSGNTQIGSIIELDD